MPNHLTRTTQYLLCTVLGSPAQQPAITNAGAATAAAPLMPPPINSLRTLSSSTGSTPADAAEPVEELHAQTPLAALRLGLTGTVTVLIKMHWPQGTNTGSTQPVFTVAQSCGNALLDAAALQIIQQRWANHPTDAGHTVAVAERLLKVIFV
jgi:outer membrane biosynthesis protein TonB